MRRSFTAVSFLLIGLTLPVMAKPAKAPTKSVERAAVPVVEVPYPDLAPIARAIFLPDIQVMLRTVAWDPKSVLPLDMTHCVAGLSPDVASGMMAPNLAKVLTISEAAATLQFLASPTWRKYMERQRPIEKKNGIFNVWPTFSAAELDEIRAFANTSAGRKLTGDLQALPGVWDGMMSVLEQSLLRCGTQEFFASPESDAFRARLRVIRQERVPPAKQESAQFGRVDSMVIPNAASVDSSEVACTAPRPTYPRRALPLSGKSVVRMLIDVDGAVIKTTVTESSGVPALDDAAEVAVKGMRCKPYVDGGKPIKVTVSQPITFEAD